MLIAYSNTVAAKGGKLVTHEVTDPGVTRVTVGSDPSNDIVLPNPLVCSRAVVLERRGRAWTLRPLPRSNVRVDGVHAVPNRTYALADQTRVAILPFVLSIRIPEVSSRPQDREAGLEARLLKLQGDLHRQVVAETPYDMMKLEARERTDALLKLENRVAELAEGHPLLDEAMIRHLASAAVQHEILNTLFALSSSDADAWHSDASWRPLLSLVPAWEAQVDRVKAAAAARLGIAVDDDGPPGPDEISRRIARVDEQFHEVWDHVSSLLHEGGQRYLALRFLKRAIKDMICGFGAIEDLLQNPTISEIMVIGAKKVYVEQNGRIEKSGRQLLSDAMAQSIMEIMVTSAPGGQIDRSKPMADVRLPKGRLNVVIGPVSVSGPTATIRKHVARGYSVDDLIQQKTLTPGAAAFLRAAVAYRCNMVISGGVGAGKTTLLEIFSSFINPRERVGLIEDVAELSLRHEHLVRMETLPANVEGKGAVTVSALVRNALRMRFDRLIIGEIRDGAAFHMLQTMNMGSDGSLTTVHANSSDDVITRLVSLAQEAASLPVDTLHTMIATAVDLFVHVQRVAGGGRRVGQIAECCGVDPTTGRVILKTLFRLNAQGQLLPTGRMPSFIDDLTDAGLLDRDVFFQVSSDD